VPLWRFIPELWDIPGANLVLFLVGFTLVAGYGIRFKNVSQYCDVEIAILLGVIYYSYPEWIQPAPGCPPLQSCSRCGGRPGACPGR